MSEAVPMSVPEVGHDDLFVANRAAVSPGTADPFILRSLLRQERTLETIAVLLTEIRDRLPDPATLVSAAAVLEPVAPPVVAPAPTPAPPPHKNARRGS